MLVFPFIKIGLARATTYGVLKEKKANRNISLLKKTMSFFGRVVYEENGDLFPSIIVALRNTMIVTSKTCIQGKSREINLV